MFEDTSCPNNQCELVGQVGRGNVILKERYGKQSTALLLCRKCRKPFSENRGTPFFGLHLKKDEVLTFLVTLLEQSSIRRAARTMGISKDTACRVLDKVQAHPQAISRALLASGRMNEPQVEKLWHLIERRRNRARRLAAIPVQTTPPVFAPSPTPFAFAETPTPNF